MLRDMVTRWQQAATDNDLDAGAEALGYTPHEIMTIASLIEAEGRGKYRNKIARVIYNRLENPDNGLTNGKLEIDATVNYALGRDDIGVALTEEGPGRSTRRTTPALPGAATGSDRRARRRGNPGCAQPGRGAVALVRHGQPQDRRDQVHRRLRPVPGVQARARDVLRDVRRRAEPVVRCAVLGDPIDHSLSPGSTLRRTRRWDSRTGATTGCWSAPAGWPGSSTGWTPSCGVASR